MEPMGDAGGIDVPTDNVAGVIDSIDAGVGGFRDFHAGEGAVSVDEAGANSESRIKRKPHDGARSIDVVGVSFTRAGNIDGGENGSWGFLGVKLGSGEGEGYGE